MTMFVLYECHDIVQKLTVGWLLLFCIFRIFFVLVAPLNNLHATMAKEKVSLYSTNIIVVVIIIAIAIEAGICSFTQHTFTANLKTLKIAAILSPRRMKKQRANRMA